MIDFLKEADKEKLAEAYLGYDILVILTDVIDKEKCIQLIDGLCATEIEDGESKFAILMHIGISNHMNTLYRIIDQNKTIPAGVVSSMEISMKDLLYAEVSPKICDTSEIEILLLCVLHTAVCKEFGEEIFDILEQDEESLETEEIIAGFTEEENKLYENIKNAAREFNEHFLKKAFTEFLIEKGITESHDKVLK